MANICIIMDGYLAGSLIGAIIGTIAAKKVKMTAMPEMVSLVQWNGWSLCCIDFIIEFDHV